MADYKYQQNLFEGETAGYVKYNISPEFGTPLKLGDLIEINGEMYLKDSKIYGVSLIAYTGSTSFSVLGQSKKSANKGTKTTFKITATVTEDFLNKIADRNYKALINFSLHQDEELTSGSDTMPSDEQKLNVFKYMLPPTITSITIGDKSGHLSNFGGYIVGKSQPHIIVLFSLETLYPTQFSSATVTIGGDVLPIDIQTAGNSYATLIANGSINKPYNSAAIVVTITDTNGGETSKAYDTPITVYDYAEPNITLLKNGDADYPLAQRYNYETDDYGNQKIVPSPSGIHVRLSCAAKISPINGKNNWTLLTSYALKGETDFKYAGFISGEDGSVNPFIYLNSKRLMPDTFEFSPGDAYTIRIELRDRISETIIEGNVEKATGYFNINKYGVSVGMRSTADAENPKFESIYPAFMYHGVVGLTYFKVGEEYSAGLAPDSEQLYTQTFSVDVAPDETISIPISKLGKLYRIDGTINAANNTTLPINSYVDQNMRCVCYRSGSTRALTLKVVGISGTAIINALYSKADTDDPIAEYVWNNGPVGDYVWVSNAFARPAYTGNANGVIESNALKINLPSVTGNNSIPFNAHVCTDNLISVPASATKLNVSAKKTSATATLINFGLIASNAPNSYSIENGGQMSGDILLTMAEAIYSFEISSDISALENLKCIINGKASLKNGTAAAGVVITKVWFD